MLSSFIEALINFIGTSILTDLFLFILILAFGISCWWKWRDKHTAFTQYTPTLLTSLGMLGTFMGIVAGLLAFDTANISTSIAPLLEGLKTAFITSLFGMFLSIVYKGVAASGLLNKKGKKPQVTKENVTAADLYQVMHVQAESLQQLQRQFCGGNNGSLNDLYHMINQQTSCLERLQTAVGGDGESSLVGQIKLLRSDINDNQRRSEQHLDSSVKLLTSIQTVAIAQQENFIKFEERLGQRLQDFADMMSKSATEQVIEVLKSVIQDFNNNLTEQFGENFKQLNSAVLELIAWQENYKQQLSEMKVQYAQGVQAITQTENSIAHISEKAQSIPDAMDVLVKVMEVNQHQVDELSRHLEAFEQVREKAVEAVPEIRSQIDMAIAGARLANEEMAKGVQESTQLLSAAVAESTETYRNAVDSTRDELNTVATITASSGVEIKNQFTTAINEINTHMRDLVDELQAGGKELNQRYKTAGEALVEYLKESSQLVNDSYRKAGEEMAKGVQESAGQLKTVVAESAENYRDAIDSTCEELSAVATTTANSSVEIREQFTVAIKDINTHMRELVDELQSGGKELNQSYKSAGRVLVEDIRESSELLNDSYRKAGEQFVKDIKTGGESFNQSYKTVSTALMADTEAMNRHFKEGLEEMQASLARTVEEQAIEHRKQADRVFAGLEGSIREALANTGESVQKQIEMIDQTMGQEVEKVMQSMGSALASISGQFTSDYSRLVQQMREITHEVA